MRNLNSELASLRVQIDQNRQIINQYRHVIKIMIKSLIEIEKKVSRHQQEQKATKEYERKQELSKENNKWLFWAAFFSGLISAIFIFFS